MAKPKPKPSSSKTTKSRQFLSNSSGETSSNSLVQQLGPHLKTPTLKRIKPGTTVLAEFKASISNTHDNLTSLYNDALSKFMIQEKDFLADVTNWLTALHKEEKSFAEANELHFSQLKPAVETLLEKMEKHVLLSEKLIQQHTLALEQHDEESGSFMDETNHIFNLCKKKYMKQIEEKNKLKKVEDVTSSDISVTSRDARLVRGLGKLLEIMNLDPVNREVELKKL